VKSKEDRTFDANSFNDFCVLFYDKIAQLKKSQSPELYDLF